MMYLKLKDVAYSYKKEKSNVISLPIFCFVILYSIHLLRSIYIVNNNQITLNILNFIEWPIYVFMFVNAISKARYKLRELILIFFVCCVFMLCYISSGYAELLKAALLIVSMRNANYKELFDVMYRILIVSIGFAALLYLLNLSNAGIQRRDAIALGYSQANSVGFVLMYLTLLTIARKSKITIWNKLILFLINLLGFILSDSRSGFFLSCFALIFSDNKVYVLIKKKRVIQIVLTIMPIILTMATVLSALLYKKNALVQVLDTFFSSRISMNHYILANEGISLMGHPIKYQGIGSEAIYNSVTKSWSYYMTVDNAYVSLLVGFGLLATIIVFFAYIKLMEKLFTYAAVNISFVMTILSIYGLTESSLISVYVAFPFILLLNERLKQSENNDYL